MFKWSSDNHQNFLKTLQDIPDVNIEEEDDTNFDEELNFLRDLWQLKVSSIIENNQD